MLATEVQLSTVCLNDANDTVLLQSVFRKLTDQVLSYQAMQDPSAKQTENMN